MASIDVNLGGVAKKAKKLIGPLGRRGRFDIDFGDLGFAGVPGKVYVPRMDARRAPLLAFAHDWTKSSKHYQDTLKHFASWGFIVVATDSGSGLFANQASYIDALSDSIEAVFNADLGSGRLRPDTGRIGVMGHGLGAGAATVLASYRTDISAVVAAFPKPIAAGAVNRSALVSAPGLIISAEDSEDAAEAMWLGQTWNGECVHRRIKAVEGGLVESNPLLRGVGLASGDHKTQALVRRLATGFLLSELAEDSEYAVFSDPEAEVPGTTLVDGTLLQKEEEKALAEEAKEVPMWQTVARAALKR